jgi:hypothetical protein
MNNHPPLPRDVLQQLTFMHHASHCASSLFPRLFDRGILAQDLCSRFVQAATGLDVDRRSVLQSQPETMTENAEASVNETRRAKRKRDFDLGEAADNATQRARHAGSPKLLSLTDSRQLDGDTCDRLSLPSMPGGQSDDQPGIGV